jgi:hypothetical protein
MVTKSKLVLNSNKATLLSMLKGDREARKVLVTDKPRGWTALKIKVFPLSPDEATYPQKVRRVR